MSDDVKLRLLKKYAAAPAKKKSKPMTAARAKIEIMRSKLRLRAVRDDGRALFRKLLGR